MSLDDLRQQIDMLDRQLVDLLVARARVTGEIGAYKRERGLALYVPQHVLDHVRIGARGGGLFAPGAEQL